MLSKICVGLVLISASTFAVAASGDVCRSAAEPMQKGSSLTEKTIFKCSKAGAVTIPQLYEKGWRVVQSFAQVANPSNMDSQWVIIVEKI